MYSEEEMHIAKLAIFAKIDKSIEPYNKYLNKIIFNIDDQIWGNYRALILNTTKEVKSAIS